MRLLLAWIGIILLATPVFAQWWLDQPVRLIQTNLREIDARDFEVEEYVGKAKDLRAHPSSDVLPGRPVVEGGDIGLVSDDGGELVKPVGIRVAILAGAGDEPLEAPVLGSNALEQKALKAS